LTIITICVCHFTSKIWSPVTFDITLNTEHLLQLMYKCLSSQ
jgi:hypothetical protein